MSEDNVVKLNVVELGDGAVLAADHVLEAHKGKSEMLIVAGFDRDGQVFIAGTHGSRDALWILERARLHLLSGGQV